MSVESAKYGEFLGVVDGCDHWDTRGANSFGRAWIEGRGGWSQFFGAQDSSSTKDSSSSESGSLEEAKESASSIAKDATSSSEESSKTMVQREREDEQARFAGTLEWIANKVPSQSSFSIPTLSSLSEPKLAEQERRQKFVNSLPPKFDLELFYIALARNLYDAGL